MNDQDKSQMPTGAVEGGTPEGRLNHRITD